METARCRSRGPSSAAPSNSTMTSFARTPPRSAGSPGMTSRTSTPRGSRSLSRSRSASVTSPIDTPSQPHSTLPFVASCGTSCWTRLDGIAKPIEPLRAAMLLTPITSPAMFTSGPPEFPGLIAASVWMKSKPGAATVRGAPLRLTMPNDTLCSRPNGWPSARTNSPTRRRFESPSGSTVRFVAPWILMSARSTRLSRPTRFPAKRRPSESLTWIDSAPSTTWAFVTMSPLGSMTKPEPVERRGSPGSSPAASLPAARRTRTCTRPGLRRSARSASSVLTRWSSGAALVGEALRQSAPRPSAPVRPAQPNEDATASIRATTAIGRDIAIRTSCSGARQSIRALPRDFTDEVGKLGDEELLERQAASIRRSRERDDDPLRMDAELGARQHRGRAHLLVGEHAEEFAEAGQALVEQRLDRLERGIARRDPRTARHDHRLDPLVPARRAHDALNVGGLVAHDREANDPMTRRVQELSDQRAAGVRLGRLRVGDGEHPAADAFRRVGLVIARSRSRISHCSGVREPGAISGWPATRCAPAPSRTPPLIPPESRELGAISGWPATRCAPAPSRTPPLIPPESRELGAISGWPASTRWSTRMPDLWAASPACMVVGLYRVRRAPWGRTSEPLGGQPPSRTTAARAIAAAAIP